MICEIMKKTILKSALKYMWCMNFVKICRWNGITTRLPFATLFAFSLCWYKIIHIPIKYLDLLDFSGNYLQVPKYQYIFRAKWRLLFIHVSSITLLFPDTQTSMNVRVLKVTSVTPTLCVPTLRDPMSAAVWEDLKEMVKPAQVRNM